VKKPALLTPATHGSAESLIRVLLPIAQRVASQNVLVLPERKKKAA